MYFRKINQDKVQFVSNHLKCAFTLMPDIYVLREEKGDKFLFINQKNTDIKIIEKKRDFTVNDYRSLMDVCNMMSNLKAMQKLQIEE